MTTTEQEILHQMEEQKKISREILKELINIKNLFLKYDSEYNSEMYKEMEKNLGDRN
jgi:hypothetical protein